MLYKRGGFSGSQVEDGMSFKTHLQVIDAETTHDILLGMDFMEENCVNSGFYRTQKDHVKELKSTDVDSFTTRHYTLVTILKLKAFWR
jgi:hypothetical protein